MPEIRAQKIEFLLAVLACWLLAGGEGDSDTMHGVLAR